MAVPMDYARLLPLLVDGSVLRVVFKYVGLPMSVGRV